MATADSILETHNLRKEFGNILAVDDVSLTFERGKLQVVIGPNGAGKTTFFNVLAGTLPPTSGEIMFDGTDITNRSPAYISRNGLVKSYQITNIFDELSTLENVNIAVQSISDVTRFNFWSDTSTFEDIENQAKDVLERVSLDHKMDTLAEDLSYGQQRLLEIGIVLATDPKLMLLDEPTSGLSPENTRRMISTIGSLAEDRTVLMIEHDMNVVENLADNVIVFHQGEVLVEGSPEEVTNNEKVKDVYLGR